VRGRLDHCRIGGSGQIRGLLGVAGTKAERFAFTHQEGAGTTLIRNDGLLTVGQL
jgi:hypothetical protein